MEDKPVILVAAIQCPPEIEERFNKWYDKIHIPMMFKFKGLKESTRYRILNETEGHPNYLTIHKFESRKAYEAAEASPEFAAARAEADESSRDWNRSEVKWLVLYEPLKTWVK